MAQKPMLKQKIALPKAVQSMTRDEYNQKVLGYIKSKYGARIEACERRQRREQSDSYPRFNLEFRALEERPEISEVRYFGCKITILDHMEKVFTRKFYLMQPDRIDPLVEEAVSNLEKYTREFVAVLQQKKERAAKHKAMMESLGFGLKATGGGAYKVEINGVYIEAMGWDDERGLRFGLDLRGLKYSDIQVLLATAKKLAEARPKVKSA